MKTIPLGAFSTDPSRPPSILMMKYSRRLKKNEIFRLKRFVVLYDKLWEHKVTNTELIKSNDVLGPHRIKKRRKQSFKHDKCTFELNILLLQTLSILLSSNPACDHQETLTWAWMLITLTSPHCQTFPKDKSLCVRCKMILMGSDVINWEMEKENAINSDCKARRGVWKKIRCRKYAFSLFVMLF